MLHRVAIVRTEVSKERSASIIRITGLCELGTTLAVTSNRGTLGSYFTDSCHPDDGEPTSSRNVDFYKSHAA
jgi:hypothetical protein